MKTYINYIKENTLQDFYTNKFLEVAHLNELVIKFDFIEQQDINIFYFYKDMLWFYFDYTKTFYIIYDVWKQYQPQYHEIIQNYTMSLIPKIFKYEIKDTWDFNVQNDTYANKYQKHFN